MRWSLCATDRCFKNGLMSAFFRAGQVHMSSKMHRDKSCLRCMIAITMSTAMLIS
jgi:hypothetical protein